MEIESLWASGGTGAGMQQAPTTMVPGEHHDLYLLASIDVLGYVTSYALRLEAVSGVKYLYQSYYNR